MTPLRLPDFTNVVAGGTATLKIPHYKLTLMGVNLVLGGTSFLKTHIDLITLKIGTRVVWTCTGADLDKINKFKGWYDQATHLDVSFAERSFLNIVSREVGGYDMSVIDDDLYLEVKIASGASAPTLYANGLFTPPQSKDADPTQLVQKLVNINVPITYSAAGAKFSINFDPKGALVKRAYIIYSGTNFTSTADGNISKLEVRKNGNNVYELSCRDARWNQQGYKLVPQANMYVGDFTFDQALEGALPTMDAQALEWNVFPLATDTARIYFEVLDRPYNL